MQQAQLSLEWFNERINHYAKIIGIQKIKNIMQMGEPETDHMHGSKGSRGASPRQCRRKQETIGGSSRAYNGG